MGEKSPRPEPPDPGPGSAFAPLAVPAYRRVWIALVVSSFGTFLQLAAGPWVMHEMTGSPLMVGLVTTALFIPRLLFSLPFGALADLVDRRRLVIAGQSSSALAVATMAVLMFNGDLGPTALLVLTFTLGFGNAVSLPALQALIPSLVPRAMLSRAVTLQAGAGNVARSLGPSAAGALIALGLTHVAFATNAISFLAVILVVRGLEPTRGPADGEKRRLLRSIGAGIQFARFTTPIRRLLIVACGFFLTTSAVQALLPSLVSDRLELGAAWYGLLYGLFGAGALVGVLSRDRVYTRVPDRLLPLSIGGFGASGMTLGVIEAPSIAAILLMVCGLFWVWTLTTLNASLQALAPGWVRGRIVSLYILTWGLQPIGALIAGAVAEAAGVGPAVSVMTAVTLALGLSILRWDIPTMEDIDFDQRIAATGIPSNDATSLMPSPPSDWGPARIVVMQTWHPDEGAVGEFREAILQLRRERLRVGATHWQMFEESADQPAFIELFHVPDARHFDAQQQRPDRQTQAVLDRLEQIPHRRATDIRYLRRTDDLAGSTATDVGASTKRRRA